jgi:hypothetical protein
VGGCGNGHDGRPELGAKLYRELLAFTTEARHLVTRPARFFCLLTRDLQPRGPEMHRNEDLELGVITTGDVIIADTHKLRDRGVARRTAHLLDISGLRIAELPSLLSYCPIVL